MLPGKPRKRAVSFPLRTMAGHAGGHALGGNTRLLDADELEVQAPKVLALEGYYEPGPVDFRSQTLPVLIRVGNAVPAAIELGYHLCYGSPADEHCVQPKDMGIMVELATRSPPGSGARPSSFTCRCRKIAPTTAILRRLISSASLPAPRSISAPSITTMPRATGQGSPRQAVMCTSTASPPNAAWRAVTRRGSPGLLAAHVRAADFPVGARLEMTSWAVRVGALSANSGSRRDHNVLERRPRPHHVGFRRVRGRACAETIILSTPKTNHHCM